MKTTKKRRSLRSKSDILNKYINELDCMLVNYEDLVLVRKNLVDGTMTSSLYTFINFHKGLESLFRGLGLPSEAGASQEAVQITEIQYVDMAIEGIIGSIVDAIKKIWNAFCDWVMDWIDTNRRMRFRLQRHLRRLKESKLAYGGSPDNYSTIEGVVYTYEEWKSMYKSVRKLNEILKNVPSKDVAKYLSANFTEIGNCAQTFGYEMSSTKGIIKGPGVPFTPIKRKIGASGGKWEQNDLRARCEEALSLLGEETESRNAFIAVRRAFDEAIRQHEDEVRDVVALRRLVRLCKLSKDWAAITARAVVDVCNVALNAG